jgi:beta-phosphoglucomutase-like phosphatase (HAD superfamily)
MTSNPNHPAAVIFDMDGLMLDTEVIYHIAWQEAARELGYEIPEGLFHDLVGLRTEDCEAQIMAAMGASFPLNDFHRRWEIVWDRHARVQGIETKPGLLELLARLEQLEIPKAVATSSTAPEAERSLRITKLIHRFPVIVTGDQVAAGKPAPDIYLTAAKRLGVDPADCIAFEDSDAGTLAASRAGMRTYQVPDLKPPSTEAASAAIAVLAGLHDALPLFEAAPYSGQRPGRTK